jgi:uncharacterized membrane protein YfcA
MRLLPMEVSMPELTVLLPLLAFLLAIGAFAGVLAGLLGVGGGIVLVPAFFYSFQVLGYEGEQLMQVCLATSLATIVVTSVRSVMSHNKKGAVDWEILRSWAPGIAIGSIIGVSVAAQLRSDMLQAIFGVLAMIIGVYMGLGKSEWRLAPDMPKGARRAGMSPAVGFLSVLMGIGGGSFGVPLMTLHNVAIHRAVATAAGFGLVIAVPGVLGFLLVTVEPASRPPYTVGTVNLVAFAIIVAMTMITAPIGANLAHRMDPKPLKRIFGLFLTLVALNMLYRSMGG